MLFLTETWLYDSDELRLDIEDLEIETGYSMLCKNRPQNDRGYSAGGVAITFKRSGIQLKEITMPDNNYEMIFSVGTLPKFSRKMIAICVYMPPGMPAQNVQDGFTYFVDCILELKGRNRDFFIAISGDFNGYDVASYMDDYPDLVLLETSPTRGDRNLDLLYTNFNDHIVESGIL